jgi:sugar (pentulose or hexulose) kinase
LLALSAVEKIIDIKIKELVVIGGGSVNRLWCRILADITGKNIRLPVNSESSALGAGIAAAVGAGWYPTFKEAAVEMTSVKEIIKPREKNHQKYQQLFRVYKNIYPALKKVRALQ